MYLASAPNPFNLAGPPAGFLAEMAAFDPLLVIFPSSTQAVYRLCRRTIGPAAPLSFMRDPDADICRRFKLAPVKAILPAPMGHFGPHILADLASYDLERAGGGKAAADRLDELDRKQEEAIERDIADEGYARGREAYRAIKGLTGQTVYHGIVKPEGAGAYNTFMRAGAPKRQRGRVSKNLRPRGGESTSGAVFVGRGAGDQSRPLVTLT